MVSFSKRVDRGSASLHGRTLLMARHLMLAFLFVFAGLLGPTVAFGQCFTPSDITVSGFGCAGPNGTYTPNGEVNSAPSWMMTNPFGTFFILWSSANSRWEIQGGGGSNRSEARGDNFYAWAANATGDITNLPCSGGWTDPLDVGCIGNDGVTLDGGCGLLEAPIPTAYMVEGGGEVCAGQGASIVLEHSDAGVYYQLRRDGADVGSKVEGINNTLDLGSYTEEGIYTVVATPGLNCTDETEMANPVEVTVLPAVVPTVSIASSDFDNAIATGTNVTFTATATGGGETPAYQWKKNGGDVGTDSDTYAAADLADGDVISCVLTSNDVCADPTMATSNDITMNVVSCAETVYNLTVTITQSGNSGVAASFTADVDPYNGKPSWTGSWFGDPHAIRWSSADSRWEIVSLGYTKGCINCEVLLMYNTNISETNVPCTGWVSNSYGPAVILDAGCSNNITPPFTVDASVSIAGDDPDNSVLTGTNVTFTATPTGGGATPRYQWKKNGTNVGTNSNTYADNTLVDGDVISCVMESNDPCATPVISTSDDITMTVEPYCLAFCNGSTEQFLYDPVVNEYLSTSGVELYKVDWNTPISWYIRNAYQYFYTYESAADTPPTGPYYISPGGSNPPCPVFVTLSAGACPTCVAPSVTCPSGPIVAANSICQATLADYTGMATPMDGCGDVALSQSPNTGTTLNHGSNTVVITATDDNGNTGTCFFTVVVADQTPPNLECPANTTVAANSNCMGTVGDHTVFGGPTRSAATTKHAPGTLERTPGGDGSLFDNCDGTPTVVQSPASGTVLSGHNDSETVTLTASDVAGNTSTCSFTVTLKDVTPPSITCPANTTVAANSSCGGTVGDHTVFGGDGRSAPDTKQGMANVPGTLERTPGNGSLSDNCSLPTVTQSPASGTVLSGHNDFETVTLTATDAAGNTSTCSFTVTLKDVTPPNLTCPANTTVAADGNCSSTVGNRTALGDPDRSAPTTKQGMITAPPPPSGGGSLFDNCDGTPTVTQSPASGTVLSGHNDFETVTLTATDAAGNTAMCSFTVTLKDVAPPTATCKAANLVLDANGNASLAAAALNDGSSDNCTASGGLTLAVSPNTFDCEDAGSTNATLTVTDAAGNTASCTATVAVLDVLHYSQQAQRMASDGLAGDNLGWGLGLSGGVAIAGAPNDKVGTQNKQGSAYVFLQNQGGTDNWGQLKQIKAFNGAAVDYFGNAVAVDGNTAAIAAYGFNHPLGGTDVGTVYIYEKDLGGANNWGFRTGVGAFDGAAYDYFGSALSLKDDVVAVGASKKKVGANNAQGAVYLYQKDVGGANNWSHVDKVVASDGGANNFFGTSLSQSNDFLLVGAPGNLSNRGAAYLFWHPANYYVWTQQQKLTASDAAVGDGFGTSVAMTGTYAVIGAPNKATYAGAAYVFKKNGGTWAELRKLAPTAPVPAVNDRFGTSVALQGDYAYVTSVRGNANAGAVYVFHKDAGGADNWGQIGYQTATGGASGDQFGYSLAVSGERMALGANLDDVASKADQGSIYIFKGEDCPDQTRPGTAEAASRTAVAASSAVQCSPNPFRDELMVEIAQSGTSNPASEILVMDATGRVAMRVELPAGQTRHTLKTNELRAGMYFVQVTSEAGASVVPVVLVR